MPFHDTDRFELADVLNRMTTSRGWSCGTRADGGVRLSAKYVWPASREYVPNSADDGAAFGANAEAANNMSDRASNRTLENTTQSCL